MLDWQIEVMERGERPDWDIVQGVIQYFLTYPDLRHHPLEDQILARLCSRHPAAAEPFIDLEVEHRALSAKLRHVAATTEALLQDVAMMKAVYLDLLRDFAAAQRDHIRREEAGFLVTAHQLLDARDWQEMEDQAPAIADPLGDPSDRQFQALRWQLARWDTADRRDREADRGAGLSRGGAQTMMQGPGAASRTGSSVPKRRLVRRRAQHFAHDADMGVRGLGTERPLSKKQRGPSGS